MKNKLIPFFLFLIVLVLAVSNYVPETWLSGWDTLHPEFNMANYFKRIFFGVWQEHQGLGALASQAHASELPRMLVYYPLVWILPQSMVRYAYFFITLFLGAFGVYYFLSNVIFRKLELLQRQIFSFLGALFYLLNLGTLQQYYVPLEMFATHFATLGWLFSFALLYLTNKKKKYFVLFIAASFFSAPMAHTATLWYSYFVSLLLFLLVFNLTNKKSLRGSLMLITATVLSNSFWLFPNLYFIFSQGDVVGSSKIHELFTEEAFAQNAAFATIPDMALFKNFLFNWGQYVGNDKFGLLLDTWIRHLKNPLVPAIGYGFFMIIIAGIIHSLVKNRSKSLPFFSLFILAVFFWLNVQSPFGGLFNFLQNNIPFFKEALRFPFTKFSILLLFTCSIYFSWGVKFLIDLLGRIIKLRYLELAIFIVFITLNIYYMLPAFQGNFISPTMKIKIPGEYFKMFDWFNNQPNGRVASLPVHSFWGWIYYNWGYQGAGFLWFGVKQPLLDREFDRWEPRNEQYYREMSYAVYTRDDKLFQQVLQKYQIRYLLLDESVIAPTSDPKMLFYPEIKELIGKDPNINKVKQFGKNISVYETKYESNFVYDIKNPASILPTSKVFYQDFGFQKYGNYITGKGSNFTTYYPVRAFIDNQSKLMPNYVKLDSEGARIELPTYFKDSTFNLPPYANLEPQIPANLTVEKKGSNLLIKLSPYLPLVGSEAIAPIIVSPSLPQNEKNILLSINQKDNFILNNISEGVPLLLDTVFLHTNTKNTIVLYPDKKDEIINPDFSKLKFSLDSCGTPFGQEFFGINPQERSGFSLFGKNTPTCFVISLNELFSEIKPNIEQTDEMLLGTKFSYMGKSHPNFCLSDLETGSCLNYSSKNVFLLPISSNFTSEFFGIQGIDISKLGLKITLDTNYDNKVETVSYKDMEFSVTKPFFRVEFNPNIIGESLKRATTTKNYSFTAPFSGNQKLSQDITSTPKTVGDCATSQLLNSPNNRINIIKKELNKYIEYSSEEGSVCDHFSYEDLPQDQAYLIAFKSRNVKGLPIRVCVANKTTKHCDIYGHLSKFKDFGNDIFLLPPMRGEKPGYDININNFGVKNTPSVNQLQSIQIISLPYNWLSQIESYEGSNTNVINFFPNSTSVEHPNPSEYFIKNSALNTNDGKSVIVLSESFNSGWKAYQSSNTIFPFFGKELKDHVVVNNWSNGWLLNNQMIDDKSSIIIVYLPQYLEYLGFLILLIVPIYLLRLKN